MSAQHFYIVSVEKTLARDPYITFWRPENKGYAWPLSWAGTYAREEIEKNRFCYHNGYTFAVSIADVTALAVPPAPGSVDGNAGPVVPNTKKNWDALIAAAMEALPAIPKPKYYQKGARR